MDIVDSSHSLDKIYDFIHDIEGNPRQPTNELHCESKDTSIHHEKAKAPTSE